MTKDAPVAAILALLWAGCGSSAPAGQEPGTRPESDAEVAVAPEEVLADAGNDDHEDASERDFDIEALEGADSMVNMADDAHFDTTIADPDSTGTDGSPGEEIREGPGDFAEGLEVPEFQEPAEPDGRDEDFLLDPPLEGVTEVEATDSGQEEEIVADAGSDGCVPVPFVPACGFWDHLNLPEPPPNSLPPYSPNEKWVQDLFKELRSEGWCLGFDPSGLDPATQGILFVSDSFILSTECGLRLVKLELCPYSFHATLLNVQCHDVGEQFGWWWKLVYVIPAVKPAYLDFNWMYANEIYHELDCYTASTPDEQDPRCCLPFTPDQCDSMFDDLLPQ